MKQIATLAGLAPRGNRMMWGGRAPVRTALYVAALCVRRWNRRLRAFYERLIAAGKPKKVTLIACARMRLTILNAIARDNQRWAPPVQHSC